MSEEILACYSALWFPLLFWATDDRNDLILLLAAVGEVELGFAGRIAIGCGCWLLQRAPLASRALTSTPASNGRRGNGENEGDLQGESARLPGRLSALVHGQAKLGSCAVWTSRKLPCLRSRSEVCLFGDGWRLAFDCWPDCSKALNITL